MKIYTICLNQYKFTTTLLIPSAIYGFRQIILTKCGLKAFPLTHTNRYRQLNFIDINNTFGRGYNQLYSITGVDKTHVISYGIDLEYYLRYIRDSLKAKKYYVDSSQELTIFRKDPREL